MEHAPFMHRALDLARNGAGRVTPNPMVGAVLVQQGRILAEGWHTEVGGPHAEVECLRAFGDAPIPEDAVMYVTLEPCTHHGRTPPCADLLIHRGLKHLVVGCMDPDPRVAGKGITRTREAGMDVVVDVLKEESRWMNRRFITGLEQARPYVILKWARSTDGFMDQHPRTDRGVQRISSAATDVLVHRWRSEEQAILVGSRTVVNDDPRLTVRLVEGRSPIRLVLDRGKRSPAASHVFDDEAPTLLFTSTLRTDIGTEQVLLPHDGHPIDALLAELHSRQVRSVLVEGGSELLSHFLSTDRWDEARVITGPATFSQGTRAPEPGIAPVRSSILGPDGIDLFTNHRPIDPAWHW